MKFTIASGGNFGFMFFQDQKLVFHFIHGWELWIYNFSDCFTNTYLFSFIFRERPEAKNYSKRFVIIWIYWKEITSAWNTKTKTTRTTGYNWTVEYWKVWKVSWRIATFFSCRKYWQKLFFVHYFLILSIISNLTRHIGYVCR